MPGQQAEAVFAVKLKEEVSSPAERAAAALGKMREKIDADTGALANMEKAMKRMQASTTVDIAAFRALTTQMDQQRASVAATTSEYVKLGGSFDKVAKMKPPKPPKIAPAVVPKAPVDIVPKGAVEQMKSLSTEAAKLPGPLGRMAQAGTLATEVFTRGRLAIIAIAAAVVALVAVTVKAVTTLYSYVTAQANARRAELLRLEGLVKIRTATAMYYGLATNKAGDLQAAVDRVSARVSIGRDQVMKYAEKLQLMGVRGKNVEAALEGMSIKASAQGEEQAQLWAGWAAGAALTGGSVQKLADRVKANLGGIVRAQMLDANVQAVKLAESYAALTTGFNIEPLLKAQKSLNDLFSQSTASGRALKQLLGTLVQPMIDAVTAAIPVVKAFFQDTIIFALRVEQHFLKLHVAFLKAFKKGEWSDILGELTSVTGFFTIALGAAAVVAVVELVPALIMLTVNTIAFAASAIAAGIAVTWPFLLAAAAIWALVVAAKWLFEVDWSAVGQAAQQVWKDLKEVASYFLDAGADLARSLWDGLVGGLKRGASAVKSAVVDTAMGAVAGFKAALGINSPSKIFSELGGSIPEGLALGVKLKAPDAQRAVDDVVTAPPMARAAQYSKPRPRDSDAGKAGATVNVAAINITAGDKATAQSIAADIRAELERVLEGVALQLGAVTAGSEG